MRDHAHLGRIPPSEEGAILQFIGRARIANSPADRNRAFDLAPEKERASDPERRWCTWPVQDEMTPNPKLLRDDRLATDGIWASGRQHPVQHSHADGSLGRLASNVAGSAEARSTTRNDPLSFLLRSVGRNRLQFVRPGGLDSAIIAKWRSRCVGGLGSPLGMDIEHGGITTGSVASLCCRSSRVEALACRYGGIRLSKVGNSPLR
jgi:hypothetical protein